MSIDPPEREPHTRNPWWWNMSVLGGFPVKPQPIVPIEITEPK